MQNSGMNIFSLLFMHEIRKGCYKKQAIKDAEAEYDIKASFNPFISNGDTDMADSNNNVLEYVYVQERAIIYLRFLAYARRRMRAHISGRCTCIELMHTLWERYFPLFSDIVLDYFLSTSGHEYVVERYTYLAYV